LWTRFHEARRHADIHEDMSDARPPITVRASRRRGRRCLRACLGTAVLALALAPGAGAAADPVKTGSLKLRLSGPFKAELKQSGVAVSPSSFSLKGGGLDPIAGTGSVTLRGKLTFKHGDEEIALKKLKATLGPGGALMAGHTTLFRLRGGTLSRRGFGAALDGVNAAFTASAAGKLTRKLELDSSLHGSKAGRLSVSAQPRTLEILRGTGTMQPASGAGSVTSKLAAHCIDPVAGMSAIAPATQPAGPGTAIVYPISSGTISPIATDGLFHQSGGMQIANGGSGLAPGCSASNTLTIQITNLSSDLLARFISGHASISGSGSPLGNLEASVKYPLNISDTWVNPDPFNRSLVSGDTGLDLDSTSASTLNFFFPQPGPGDPALEFHAGDSLGTVGLEVSVR
jgi:hypothetical protein